MKCPKCGIENKDDAKVCSSCGASFSKRFACPKCRAEVFKDDKKCSNCGSPLDWIGIVSSLKPIKYVPGHEKKIVHEVINEEITKDDSNPIIEKEDKNINESITKVETNNANLYKVFVSIFFFFALALLIAGCFLKVAIYPKQHYYYGSLDYIMNEPIYIDYYFGKGMKELIDILKSNSYKNNAFQYFSIILMVVSMFTYYNLFLSILVFGTFQTINIVKYLKNKSKLNLIMSIFLFVSALLHLFIVLSYFLVDMSSKNMDPKDTNLQSLLGEGTIIIIVSVSLLFLLFIINRVYQYYYLSDSKKDKPKLILDVLSMTLIFSILMLSFGHYLGFYFEHNVLTNSYTYKKVTISIWSGVIQYFLGLIEDYSLTGSHEYLNKALPGFILYSSAIILFFVTLISYFIKKDIVFLLTSLFGTACLIAGGILLNDSYQRYIASSTNTYIYYKKMMSPQMIISFVFSVAVAFIGLIKVGSSSNERT